MEVSIRPARLKDCAAIAAAMRKDDVKEIWLSGHKVPLEALTEGLKNSDYCMTVWVEGVSAAMFGVAKYSLLSDTGSVWLLGTDKLSKIKKSFVKLSKPYLQEMFGCAERLENYVWVDNKLSVRWLKWCGFDFAEPAPYGPDNALFIKFRKEK